MSLCIHQPENKSSSGVLNSYNVIIKLKELS